VNDIEDLLRETLSDGRRKLQPNPDMYEAVQRHARQRRHQRSLVAVATVCVLALAVAGSVAGFRHAATHRTNPTASGTTTPSPTATTSPVPGGLSDLVIKGSGWVTAAAVAPDALYVLTMNPPMIIQLDVSGTHVIATGPAPSGGGTASGLAVDGNSVVGWSQETGQLLLYNRSGASLTPTATLDSGLQVFNVAVLGGTSVWMSTNDGLYRWSPVAGTNGPNQLSKVAGIVGPTYGLAADPARGRVLVGVMPDVASSAASSSAASSSAASSSATSSSAGAFAGAQIDAVDARTGAITRGAVTGLGKESIVVAGGQVWVGGYGDGPQLLLHLDPVTLQPTPDQPKEPSGLVDYPGVILWPGANVLWLRSGGNEALGCLDPATGAVLEQWPAVEGPVTSVPGHAYALTPSPKSLQLTGGCTG
jgi:hypothetical protein